MSPKEKSKIGLIAQEIENVFPEIINDNKLGVKTVDLLGFTPLTFYALKLLYNKVNEIEGKI